MTAVAGRSLRSRRALLAVALFAAARVAAVIVLDVVLRIRDAGSLHHMLTRYDGQWYARIAEHGYGFTLHAHDGPHSDYSFFPLLPALERLVHTIVPMPFADIGLVVNWVAALVAAAGVFALTARLTDQHVATVAVVLWAMYPYGIVLSMSYTEGLLCALAAWALFAAADDRWVLAGTLAGLAGLTRPTSASIVAAVCLAVLLALLRGRVSWPRALATIVLAPAGLLGYLAYVAVRRHELMGYFRVTAGWARSWDGGRYFARWCWHELTQGGGDTVGAVIVIAVLAGMVWLILLGVRDGLPIECTVYGAVLILMTIGTSGYFGSRPRYLLPAFTILIPLAARLTRRRAAMRIPLAALLTVTLAVVGAYALTTGAP